MSIKAIVAAGYSFFLGLTKKKLIDIILSLREQYTKAQDQIEKLKGENIKIKDENAKLKEELKQHKIKAVNSATNKPSSKQAEWEDKGNNTDQNNEGKKKKKKKRTRKPRTGAGNKAKNRKPDRTETATVDQCDLCGKDLSDKQALNSSNERIIEDIPDPVEKTDVIQIIQEKKYCDDCKASHHGEIGTGVARSRYRAQCECIDMLPLGRPVFALSEDKGLSKSIFRIRDIHGGLVKPCHTDFETHERCL